MTGWNLFVVWVGINLLGLSPAEALALRPSQPSEDDLVARLPSMTVLSILPRHFTLTTHSILAVAVLPWSAGALGLRVLAESARMYPFALEACRANLELVDDRRVPVSLRFDGRMSDGWSRYVVRFSNHHDIPRVRFLDRKAAKSTVRAVEFSCAESGRSQRFVNAASK